jgi:hypothetical protein
MKCSACNTHGRIGLTAAPLMPMPPAPRRGVRSIIWIILVIIAALSVCGGIANLFLAPNTVNRYTAPVGRETDVEATT